MLFVIRFVLLMVNYRALWHWIYRHFCEHSMWQTTADVAIALLEISGEIRALWHRIEPEHACLSMAYMACGIADGFFFR